MKKNDIKEESYVNYTTMIKYGLCFPFFILPDKLC